MFRYLRILAAAILLFPTACTGDTSSAPATTPAAVGRPGDPPAMYFDTTKMPLAGKEFTIELALSGAQQERGLMFRDSMPADHGMLFVFDKPEPLSFWMKNTRIPLDIIYIDATGHIVEIQQRQPLDERGMGPAAPTQFVIELNLGAADKLGLKRGDKVEIPKKYLKN